MKRYNITVNGKTYSVDVEEVDIKKDSRFENKANNSTDGIQPIEISSSAIEIDVKQPVKSPLAGEVVDVKKNTGDRVSYGETLIIISVDDKLNDIGSPRDGVVTSVNVKVGDNVTEDFEMMVIN